MATRVTRKELRQPDWFQVASEKAIEFIEARKAQVISAAVIVLLVLVGTGGLAYRGEREKIAG